MLSNLGGFYPLAAIIQILVTLLAYAVLSRKAITLDDRTAVVRYGIFFVLAVTAEWWILGSRSFIYPGDDGEVAAPLFLYLARIHDGGQFAPGLVGGIDAKGMLGGGTGLFSLEVFLFTIFPPWLAVGVDKIIAASIAFTGSYHLARSRGGASRSDAFVLAASYTLAYRYVLMVSLPHGVGFALLPLAVNVFVGRLGRPRYLVWVSAVAVLNAISFTPSTSGQALGLCLVIAWLAEGAKKPLSFLLGLIILAIPTLVNYGDWLLAIAANASLSLRADIDLSSGLADLPVLLEKYFTARNPEAVPAVLASLALIWVFGRKIPIRAIFMLGAAYCIGPILNILPWRSFGLGLLASLDFTYSIYAFPALLILVEARAAAAWRAAGAPAAWRWLTPPVLIAALVAGQFVWFKLNAGAQLLASGGQSIYRGYADLARRDWRPDHPFRVATIPYRLDSNTVTTYGLESADGVVNISPGNRGRYWLHALTHRNPGVFGGQMNIAYQGDMDFLCCRSYDAEAKLDLDALKLINVEFIISVLPLYGGGLTQVAGAAESAVPPRRDDSAMDKVQGLVQALIKPELHIYRIPGAMPRAYVAQGLMDWPSNGDVAAQYRDVVARGLLGVVSLTTDNVVRLSGGIGSGRVVAVRSVRDGYDLETDLPGGGVVVINAAFTPFWHARADDQPVTLVEANGAQMAVRVPAGTRNLELRYQRPSLLTRSAP